MTELNRPIPEAQALPPVEDPPMEFLETALSCLDKVRRQVETVMVGQEEIVSGVLAALAAGGHVLLEGPPGTGKTLLVKAFAAALKARFRRVQMTPDLMPSDLIGTSVYDFNQSKFRFVAGPVFTNLLLADEINRAPAKTQSALLECMGERQVTVEGHRCKLPKLFVVLATQNPIEQEGTYPLPEAQLDRFMLKLNLEFLSNEQEIELLELYEANRAPMDVVNQVKAVTDEEEMAKARAAIKNIAMSAELRAYLSKLVQATRDHPLIAYGAGPRATVDLFRIAKARAALDGRTFCIPDDIKGMYQPVVGHRVLLTPDADMSDTATDEILAEILEREKVPR